MVNFDMIQTAWNAAKTMDFSKITPDPGIYNCSIFDAIASVCETKKGLMARVKWIFTIIDGDMQGAQFEKVDWLTDEKSCGRLKGNLKLLGLQIPDNPNDLDVALRPVAGMDVQIEVKVKDGFTNIYIRRVLSVQEKQADPNDLSVFDTPPQRIEAFPDDQYLY